MVGTGLSGRAEGHPVQERHRAGAGIQAAGGDLQQDGTLTVGQPKVVEVAAVDNPLSEDGLVWLVASAEESSEHPLAQAVVDHAKERRLKLAEPTTFEAILGHGLRAIVDGRTMLVGNHKLMRDGNIALDDLGEQTTSLEGARRTVVYAAVDGQAAGIIAIADAIRPTARQMVAEMQQLGVQVVMLTGDNRAIPERIACELGGRDGLRRGAAGPEGRCR